MKPMSTPEIKRTGFYRLTKKQEGRGDTTGINCAEITMEGELALWTNLTMSLSEQCHGSSYLDLYGEPREKWCKMY